MISLRTLRVLTFVSPQSWKKGGVGKRGISKMVCLVFAFCIATAIGSSAQYEAPIYSFCSQAGCADGIWPGGLVQATDGNFYGTASEGGSYVGFCSSFGVYGCGTLFKITGDGTFTTLYTFCTQPNCADGAFPYAGLAQGADGNFYGITESGGNNSNCSAEGGCGTVFKITPAGALTTLYNFCPQTGCPDGQSPQASLVLGADGSFYGTTSAGGDTNICAYGCGTVFKVTPEGALTTLYSFCPQAGCADGEDPLAALVQGTDGNFYGTTAFGGASSYCGLSFGCGTLFKITPEGTLTTLYSFCRQTGCPDGLSPEAGLVQATDGSFYGTTLQGGASSSSFCGSLGCGTVFKITPEGTLTTLYTFCTQPNCADGAFPYAGLVQATDGNFYGTAASGGSNDYCRYGCGTVFEITGGDTLTSLYSFCSLPVCADGAYPEAGLVLGSDGNLYGTTAGGGARNSTCGGNGCGTVFGLYVAGGDPFVETLPASGKVGAPINIVGNTLTGATRVSFNGTAAKFQVVTYNRIATKVPAGATTGTIEVTTPGGTLRGVSSFKVTPQLRSFRPKSGPVGTQVQITGVSVTQTSAVAFGGVAVTQFIVNSDKQVTATVPAGAVTGPITITTLGGTVTSGGKFKVTK